MIRSRHLPWVLTLAIAAPGTAAAQVWPWGGARATETQRAFDAGHERGLRAGTEDARRGDAFSFVDESDYRRGDIGYRSQFGTRDRYRTVFREGFESGYRIGYSQESYGSPRGRGSNNGSGWGWGRGRGAVRFDVASQTGYNDGYAAGLDDGRDGRRFDPVSESRYRSADHEYDRRYGSRESYQNNYRVGFRQGYETGYEAGRRYR